MNSKLPCPFKAYFDRKLDSINGLFTIQAEHTGIKLFTRLPARSGQEGYSITSWVRGKSPIPYSNDLGNTELKIHLKCPKQLQHWPSGGEVGEFWPISNSEQDTSTIQGISRDFIRKDIGLHPENQYKGSAGCIVLLWDTPERKASLIKLHNFLMALAGKYDFIPLKVI